MHRLATALGGFSLLVTCGALSASCGGDFNTVLRVASVRGSNVCLENLDGVDLAQGNGCFDQRNQDLRKPLQVGDCVEVRHEGESANILKVRRVASSRCR